ncbi:MAG TPA: LysR family transcriptional regulator [Stellaceae bacterium]
MYRLEDIETFVRVVDAGTLTEAARRLGISKSVVSRRLSELERTLGVRLLQRSTRHLGLTHTGAAFYERCVAILADLGEAVDAVTEQTGELKGHLRLAVPVSFGILHLGSALCGFMQKHPGVSLDLDLNDRYVDLVSEGYDMAVRIGRLPDSSLIARRLATSRRVLCCSPAYAARRGLPERLADLAGHDCLTYASSTGQQLQWQFQNGNEIERVRVDSRFHANNGDVLRDAAVGGLGITVLPTFLVADPIGRGQLQIVLPDCEPVPGNVYAIYPQNRHLSAKVRGLVDHLLAAFGDPPYWDAVLGASRAA